ncbi:flagellar biosynthesis protein FlhB [Abyssisolibacter fermentans]|uniref:flagellar biosynthesis protein FlhB n=1 Tax=Abyssisolibacter fermentans TaxID=1766203 RepID=UPI00082AD498|nr:flagellar biosynthesis protein FlhB [Abyssisolibacter fermentans]
MEKVLNLNLQLFASEEKTEKPTPKKLSDARKKGQVFKSRELNSVVILAVLFVTLNMCSKSIGDILQRFSKLIFEDYILEKNALAVDDIRKLFLMVIMVIGRTVGPLLAVAFIMGLIVNYLQVGFLFTFEPLKPKLSRINPLEGFKRILSVKSIVELIKANVKIFLVGYVVFKYVKGEIVNLYKICDMSINNIINYIGSITFGLAIRAVGVLLILAVLDYIYQKWDYHKNLKMTKQEIKEENKQMEGNPQIKSKIKEKQRQIAMRRMMQDVPKADVIITNPTHFAIAIKYDKTMYDAPYVLAKGKDLVAQKIKEVAGDNSIPLVENRPLARSLYKSVEIGQIIPEDLYHAVAEVLAYVYSLKQQ